MREVSYDLIQKPPSISSWLNTKMARPVSGNVKIRSSGFSGSGQYYCGRKIVQQPIQGTIAVKFRRSGSSSIRALSDALLLDRATNV
jgi:hypothetical protein